MYFISYTSKSGITIGCAGESFVDAVATLSEEFSEEIISVYAAAREELLEVIEDARQLLTEEEVRASGAAPRYEHGASAAASVRAAAAKPAGGDADREPPPFDLPPGLRGEAEETGTPTEVPLRQGSDSVCVVCGDDVAPDMAKASKLMFGELRCAECMA